MTAGRPRSRRTPWWLVDDLVDAVEVAAVHGDVLVVDLENTLVPYGSSFDDRRAALAGAVEVVAAHGGIGHLAVISNARFRLPLVAAPDLRCTVVTAARKPHLWCPPLRALRHALRGAAVYGDQPLTDGLLARNLDGVWLQPRHAARPSTAEPWWPRLMRARGGKVIRREFAPGRAPGSPA